MTGLLSPFLYSLPPISSFLGLVAMAAYNLHKLRKAVTGVKVYWAWVIAIIRSSGKIEVLGFRGIWQGSRLAGSKGEFLLRENGGIVLENRDCYGKWISHSWPKLLRLQSRGRAKRMRGKKQG
jgi:hypothetical protein